MENRFRRYRRTTGGVFYVHDSDTDKQVSLGTRDRAEAVKVTVENGVLTITGERKFEKEEKDKKYHRIERAYGNFLRSFTLPDAADGAKVNAEFKDGVLKVHLPKNEKAKPKAVEVKVS